MKYEMFNIISKEVSKVFGVEEKDIFRKGKSIDTVGSRYLIYYLSKINGIRPTTIVQFLERKGYKATHSMINYGVGRVEEKIKEDRDYKLVISKINGLCLAYQDYS